MTAESIIAAMVNRTVGRFQPPRVVLFGSQVRSSANKLSDVDLLVVMGNAPDKRQAAVEIRRSLGDLPVSKDSVVTAPVEIARRGHVVGTDLHSALREGKVVYERP